MRIAIGAVAAVALITSGAALAKPIPHKAHHATAFQLNATSWTYTDKNGDMQESIGPKGDYVINSGAKHVDHGKTVMKGGKACFTSAMTKDGENCWTTKPTAIGASMDTTSTKGEKLTVTRVKYTPPKM